jgi:hypothetical protein
VYLWRRSQRAIIDFLSSCEMCVVCCAQCNWTAQRRERLLIFCHRTASLKQGFLSHILFCSPGKDHFICLPKQPIFLLNFSLKSLLKLHGQQLNVSFFQNLAIDSSQLTNMTAITINRTWG